MLILGAAGRDFHVFLVRYRDDPGVRVVGFTAAQIPGIEDRTFPAALAGPRYPAGVPIYPEAGLEALIAEQDVEEVCLAYSDLSHQEVMEKASRVLAAGARFTLPGPDETFVASRKPVVAVTAVRTGCGKSQTARALAGVLRRRGYRVVAIRHAMPYGDLLAQAAQRFAADADLDAARTTIEEEEEYQPWIDHGFVVHAGVDYRCVVAAAQAEADVLVFDGGNNDTPFVRPDLELTLVDPHRAGHESTWYPGLVNLLRADLVLVNKVDSALSTQVEAVEREVRRWRPDVPIVRARSEITVTGGVALAGKRCVVVGDGPTLTHGGASFGAGTLAVERHGGLVVDPRPWLVGSLRDTFARHGHLRHEIPAMGYSPQQVSDLQATVNAVPADLVVDGTPARLERVARFARPVVDVRYELGAEAVAELDRWLLERGFPEAR